MYSRDHGETIYNIQHSQKGHVWPLQDTKNQQDKVFSQTHLNYKCLKSSVQSGSDQHQLLQRYGFLVQQSFLLEWTTLLQIIYLCQWVDFVVDPKKVKWYEREKDRI